MSGPQGYREKQLLREVDGMASEKGAKIAVPRSRPSLGVTEDPEHLAKEMAEVKQENHFLRQYVVRLENEMKVYQSRFPELNVKLPSEPMDAELPPWVANAQYMNPLLVAYQRRIDDLTQKNEGYFSEMKDLRERFQKLAGEATAMQAALAGGAAVVGGGGEGKALVAVDAGPRAATSSALPSEQYEELRETQQRVVLLRQQVEVLEKQNSSLVEEIKRERTEADAARAAQEQGAATVQRLAEEKRSNTQAIGLLTAEAAEAKGKLTKLQAELVELDAARQRLKSELKSRDATIAGEAKAVAALKRRALELQEKTDEALRERDVQRGRTGELEARGQAQAQTVSILEASLKDRDRRLEIANKQIAAADGLIEASRARENKMARDLAEARRSAAEAGLAVDKLELLRRSDGSEIARLQTRLRDELERVRGEAQRTKEALFTQNKQAEAKAAAEIKAVSLERMAQQEAAESLRRAKSSLEAQLKAVKAAGLQQQTAAMAEANAARAEQKQAKLELEMSLQRLKKLTARLAEGEESWSAQRVEMSDSNSKLRSNLDQRTAESRALEREAKMLRSQCATLEEKAKGAEEANLRNRKRFSSRIDDMSALHRKEMADLQARLDEAYSMHEEAERRAEAMVKQQVALTEKWKNHAQVTSRKMGGEIRALKADLQQMSSARNELETKSSALIADRQQSQLMHGEYEKRCRHLEGLCAGLKAKAAHLNTQLTSALAKEPILSEEMRRLQQELETVSAEKERLVTENKQVRRRLELEEQGKALEALTDGRGGPEGDEDVELLLSATGDAKMGGMDEDGRSDDEKAAEYEAILKQLETMAAAEGGSASAVLTSGRVSPA